MAHRTNVIQVLDSLEEESQPQPRTVKDVVCGLELDRRSARHMLARGDQMYYFCSAACRDRFVSGKAA